MTTKSITPGQKKGIVSFGEELFDEVLESLGLDREQAQKLLGSGGELKKMLGEPVAAAMRQLSLSHQYANEVVRSSYTYPSEYKGPKPLSQQIDILAGAFGFSLGGTVEFVEKVLPGLILPDGAEGWFAIPSVEAVTKLHLSGIKNSAEQYCRAVELIIEKLSTTRTVYNWRQGKIGTQYLRQHPRTVEFFARLAGQQKGDILVIPAQLGLKHRGESVRRARETFSSNEFGFGAFAVGCMTLTHPERFIHWELHTDCPGDEYDFGARGQWFGAPIWRWNGVRLEFDTGNVNRPDDFFGSASAFLPER